MEFLDGFVPVVEQINKVPKHVLIEMCQDVSAFLQYKTSFLPVDHYKMCLADKQIDVKLVINALTHIFRTCAKEKQTSDTFYERLKNSLPLGEDALLALKYSWNEQGHLLSNSNTNTNFNVGELIDIQWKLCVGMSSSNCKSLNSPYVTAFVTSSNSVGTISTKSFEMTLTEFKRFSNQMKNIHEVMEIV